MASRAPIRLYATYAYPVFNKLPEGCFAHLIVDDSCDAVFRLGEMVVVDPSQVAQEIDHHYLFEWRDGGRSVIELFQLGNFERPAVGGVRRRPFLTAVQPEQTTDEPITNRWFDACYPSEYLATRLKGRVLGILEPSFEEAWLRHADRPLLRS